MWWWLGCALPETDGAERAAEHLALQTEMGALDQRLGAMVSRVGALETDVERRLAAAEAQLGKLAEEAEQQNLSESAARAAWRGRWTVRAEPALTYGCDDEDDRPDSFRWSIEDLSDRQLVLTVEGGETRFRRHTVQIEPGSGALTAGQFIGDASSILTVSRKGDALTGHRVYHMGDRPCAKIWRLTGERMR